MRVVPWPKQTRNLHRENWWNESSDEQPCIIMPNWKVNEHLWQTCFSVQAEARPKGRYRAILSHIRILHNQIYRISWNTRKKLTQKRLRHHEQALIKLSIKITTWDFELLLSVRRDHHLVSAFSPCSIRSQRKCCTSFLASWFGHRKRPSRSLYPYQEVIQTRSLPPAFIPSPVKENALLSSQLHQNTGHRKRPRQSSPCSQGPIFSSEGSSWW